MANRVYLIPGKNIVIWDSWTPLVLANNKAITPDNTISLTRYDNGIPVVYQVGASDNPKNFTQLIKNVTYFIEAKTSFWLYNAVSPGKAAEQSPPKPIPAPAPTPAPTPAPAPVPAGNPLDQQDTLAAAIADLEQQLLLEATSRKDSERDLFSRLQAVQAAIGGSQPLSDNLSNISKLACTVFGLGFLALENTEQGREKIGALSLEDLNTVLGDLRLLISAKQPLSDALSLLSSIGITDFAIRLLTLDSDLELKKLIDFDQLSVQLLSELETKQPLSEQLSAIALLKTTDFGLGLLALEGATAARNQIGAVSDDELQHYAKLTSEGTVPTALLPLSLSLLASLKTTDFGLALLTLRDAISARNQIGAISVEDLHSYAQLAADGTIPLSLLPSSLNAIASLKTTDFGRALLTLVDAASARSRIGAVSVEDLQSYAKLTGDGTIPTSLLPNQSLVNVATVNSAEEMLALTNIQPGDVVIRRDLSTRKIFTLLSLPASNLGNWERSSIGVQTLNGQSGPVVNLAAADVGADPTGSADQVSRALQSHSSDSSNPHRVTASQVGADPAGSANQVSQLLQNHSSDSTNPHHVTAAQINADLAGSADRVQALLGQHASDSTNPHHVTASQVGADPAGSSASVLSALRTHSSDTANPHRVTAAQVGAEPAGSFNVLLAQLVTHSSDTSNPHHTTATQVGAEPAGAVRTHESTSNHPVATQTAPGMMSAVDKLKIDSLSVPTRQQIVLNTDTLASQQTGNYSLKFAKSFNLLRVEVSSACRLRIYSSPGYRAADSARAIGVELKPGNGLISEVIFAGQLAYDLDSTFGSSVDNSDAIAFAITNTSSAPVAITLTLTYLKLE